MASENDEMSSERLLGGSESSDAGGARQGTAAGGRAGGGQDAAPPSSAIDWRFAKNAARLVRLASSARSGGLPARSVTGGSLARLRPWALPLLFAAVQLYNIAGFFSVLVPSMFYSALTSEASGSAASATDAIDMDELKSAISSAALYLSLTVVAKAVMTVLSEFIALQWREALTLQLQARYMRKATFYQLSAASPHIDNPDQRLSAEVAFWCTESAALFVTASQALFNISYYTYKTKQLTGGWFGPLMVYAYAVVSLVSTKLVASPIANVVAAAEKAEGDYRRDLIELTVSAESIAMSGDASAEAAALRGSFGLVLRLRCRIVVLHFFLNLLVFFMDYAGSVVNYLILAAAVLAGMFDSHQAVIVAIAQGSGFTLMIIFGFSQIVDVASRVSALAGYTTRIVGLLEAIEAIEVCVARNEEEERHAERRVVLRPRLPAGAAAAAAARVNGGAKGPAADDGEVLLECRDLVVGRAEHAIAGLARGSGRRAGAAGLGEPLSFALRRGGSMLIMGSSGCGKTSLLRTIRGLWCTVPAAPGPKAGPGPAAGKWQLGCVPPLQPAPPGAASCLFLPQAVYLLPRASLRQQLVYPDSLDAARERSRGARASDDALLLGLLEEVGMPAGRVLERVGGLDATHANWPSLLPPGQRQCLAAARLCFHAPALALVDEGTSMMSTEAEAAVYAALRQRGIAVLSVGHRESLRPLHDQVLVLESDS